MADERKRTPGFRRNHDRAAGRRGRRNRAGVHPATSSTPNTKRCTGEPRPSRHSSSPSASIGTVGRPGCRHGHAAQAGCRQPAPQGPARGGPVFWIFGIGLAVAGAFWVSGGHALVRRRRPLRQRAGAAVAARCASPASPRASTHRRAAPSCSSTARRPTTARTSRTLPPLDIGVTGNDGQVTRYRLGTSRPPAGAGRNVRLFEPSRCA